MNKNLRFLMLTLLCAVFSVAWGENLTWDLSTNSYSSADENEVIWTSDFATMTIAKGNSSTAANNYLGGTGTYKSTRFYKNSVLTITPASGCSISSIIFTATTDNYATALKNSTWTNASATVSTSTVTITPTNQNNAISAIIGGTCGFTKVTVTYSSSKPGVATINTDDEELNKGATGSFSSKITPASGVTASDYTVSWQSDKTNVLSFNASGEYTANKVGTAKVTVTVTTTNTNFTSVSESFDVKVVDPNANDGSLEKPFTVAEAIAYIDEYGNSTDEMYVTGIVCQIDNITQGTYWISEDGTTVDMFEIFKGKNLNGTSFAEGDLEIGDELIIKGKLYKYNTTYELNTGSVIISRITKTPVVTLGELSPTDITLGDLDEFDLEITPADGITTSDYTLSWVSSNPTNFEIDGNTYSANAEGNYTVTVTASTTKEGFKNVSKEFDVTVTGVDPALKFEPSFLNVDIGGTGSSTFTKATTANVTFSNDNPSVATYDPETGTITAIKEGKAVITASAQQKDQYKAGTAKLTIMVQDMAQKGGLNNPYTVQEIIDSENQISGDIYVKGYIVGFFTGSSSISTSNITSNTNIALADNAEETDIAKIIPVELPNSQSNLFRNSIAANIEGNLGIQVQLKGKNQTYFSQTSGFKGTSEAYIITNISNAGYSTAYYGHTALEVPTGTTAYAITVNGNDLTYTSVGNIIPKETGVVLQGSGEQKLKVTTTSNTVSNNDLLGFDIASVTVKPEGEVGNYLFYMLSGGVNGVGFYYATTDSEGKPVEGPNGQAFISGAHKAYLAVEDTGGTTVSSYVFDDFTNIKTIDTEVRKPEGVYTITGVRMNSEHLPAGLYIVNGKKVIIK